MCRASAVSPSMSCRSRIRKRQSKRERSEFGRLMFSAGAPAVVPPVERVGGGQHGAARVERRGDAGLGDGDGLLLHHLVDRAAVVVVHL